MTVGRDGLVEIEMHSNGWYYLGIHAYPEGYAERPPPFRYGDRKLLEGLWYYDEGYRTDPEAYDKRIDELLSKNEKIKSTVLESGPGSDRSGGESPQP